MGSGRRDSRVPLGGWALRTSPVSGPTPLRKLTMFLLIQTGPPLTLGPCTRSTPFLQPCPLSRTAPHWGSERNAVKDPDLEFLLLPNIPGQETTASGLALRLPNARSLPSKWMSWTPAPSLPHSPLPPQLPTEACSALCQGLSLAARGSSLPSPSSQWREL